MKPAPTQNRRKAFSAKRRVAAAQRNPPPHPLGADVPSYPRSGALCTVPCSKAPIPPLEKDAAAQVVISGSLRWISLRHI